MALLYLPIGNYCCSNSLRYFRDRLRIPWVYQVVLEGSRDTLDDGVRCVPTGRFLAALV